MRRVVLKGAEPRTFALAAARGGRFRPLCTQNRKKESDSFSSLPSPSDSDCF